MSCESKQRARFLILIAPLAAGISGVGCAVGDVPIDELESPAALEVHLDSNVKAHLPGRQIKFFVDIINQSGDSVDFGRLLVELQASPAAEPGKVLLKEDWTFNWKEQKIRLRPEKRVTVPIVPEVWKEIPDAAAQAGGAPDPARGVANEFPLDLLSGGDYDIVAVVNGRFRSRPYRLQVVRPDVDWARGRRGKTPQAPAGGP